VGPLLNLPCASDARADRHGLDWSCVQRAIAARSARGKESIGTGPGENGDPLIAPPHRKKSIKKSPVPGAICAKFAPGCMLFDGIAPASANDQKIGAARGSRACISGLQRHD
jgi:hypothetical protein